MRQIGVILTTIIITLLFAMQAKAGEKAVIQQELHLPALFDDGMVIQREAPINVWGWAKTGDWVNVTLNGEKIGRAHV